VKATQRRCSKIYLTVTYHCSEHGRNTRKGQTGIEKLSGVPGPSLRVSPLMVRTPIKVRLSLSIADASEKAQETGDVIYFGAALAQTAHCFHGNFLLEIHLTVV
jgi:hypothetical protein